MLNGASGSSSSSSSTSTRWSTKSCGCTRPSPPRPEPLKCAVGLKTRSGTGVVLPVDARVAVSLDMLHREPQVWGADAAEFRPERWEGLRGNALEGQCNYLPFLTEPRRCPCSGYVMQQAKVFLAVLVLEADLEVTNAATVRKRLGPVSEPTVSLVFSVQAHQGMGI
ncbi:hypothetical protein BO82DRAFT_412509 [Aspergillus uvarum CBS 121591]|uniref:Cytochrome P450 n=1 Tax=Aspergillus uvarum CBS 121591 TaxID=1448315 RepID=A0A319CW61_9EURO|nr:hypothetical protein BO82DRAFT_412509 [Aspergillus uvarum CBS 121591]PYH86737.1 hypothetical protein BO82DRAFT_412509 [Aspergillus uvarum CBS 121591]